MASAVSDIYIEQMHTARSHIHVCFKRAHELLTVRETNLLRELDDVQRKYEEETKSHKEELQGLEVSKQALNNNLRNNDALNEALAVINREIDQIMQLSSRRQSICFHWNADLERDLQHAGQIIISNFPKSDLTLAIPYYKNKSLPVIACCEHSDKYSPEGAFQRPCGLAIEPQTGRIYIADCSNNRVQVLDSNGDFCFMFNHKMKLPYGICILNDTIYISQFEGHYIALYKLYGMYVSKVGSSGNGNGQFYSPTGIAISDTGYLYVCDCGNDRLQIFNKSLKFHSIFGNKTLSSPRDVKLTAELVIVLDERNPCVHIFNITDHSFIRSIISRGSDEQIACSFFFTINKELNIIIVDNTNNSIKVFSKAGDFIAQFGKEGHSKGEFINPTGISIDSQIRIVVVSQNSNYAVQMF